VIIKLFWRRFWVLLLIFGVAFGSFTVGQVTAANQPNMVKARTHLQQAKGFLNAALHDKAGHRVKAISLVDQAIAEVDLGIAAGN
jgi:hypothetical protein